MSINSLTRGGGVLEARTNPASAWARKAARFARQQPLGAISLAIILFIGIVGLAAPLIAPHGVNDIAGPSLAGPSWDHPFGTDSFGRDMASRVVFGARISLSIGFFSVIGATALGTVVGMYSGYAGRWTDIVIQRIVDAFMAFPVLILVLVMVSVLEPSVFNVIIAIGIAITPRTVRVIRSQVLSEKQTQYVEAARSLGASPSRVVFRHLFPNVLPLAIVTMTTLLGTAILAETSLSFLGLGVPPPNPSWGADVNAARGSFPIHLPWAVFPGAAIALTVLAFSLLGDALRDVLDPRLRGSR